MAVASQFLTGMDLAALRSWLKRTGYKDDHWPATIVTRAVVLLLTLGANADDRATSYAALAPLLSGVLPRVGFPAGLHAGVQRLLMRPPLALLTPGARGRQEAVQALGSLCSALGGEGLVSLCRASTHGWPPRGVRAARVDVGPGGMFSLRELDYTTRA